MAEDHELNYVIRFLFPDNKVPALDTREAEASIAKLKAQWAEFKREMGGSLGGPSMPFSPGGSATPFPAGYPAGPATVSGRSPAPLTPPSSVPGFSPGPSPSIGPGMGGGAWSWDKENKRPRFIPDSLYPSPALPGGYTPSQVDWARHWASTGSGRGQYAYAAGPGFASGGSGISWANNAPGVGNWSLSSGQWHQGPISDPGSWAAASQASAAGYASAMAAAEFDTSKLETYAQGLQKLRTGMSQVRESTTGLAASVILLNKAFQEGSGFDNPWTMAIGGMGAASHGMNLANGAGRGIQGAATIAGRFAAGAGMGSLAAQLGGLAGMSGLGLASLVGIPAAATAGAFYLGPGGFRDTWAEQERQDKIGAGLDRRREAFWAERTRRTMDGISSVGFVASGISSAASADYMRFQGGAVTASQLAAENSRRMRALDINAQSLWGTVNGSHAGTPGGEEAKLAAAKELNSILEDQKRIIQENAQSRAQELQTQIQQVQAAQRQREAERETARSINASAGRVSASDWRRGRAAMARVQSGGLNERDAEILDGLPGYGGKLEDWFRGRGQERIDSIPQGWREEGARTGQEMKQLEAKIKQLEAAQTSATKAIADNATLSAEAWKRVDDQMRILNNTVTTFISRQNGSRVGR